MLQAHTTGRIFCLFVSSECSLASRYAILQSCIDITLKSPSNTKCECKIENVKEVKFQTENVISVLIKVRETTEHSLTYTAANLLNEEIFSYRFLIAITVWYNILFHINLVSKMI